MSWLKSLALALTLSASTAQAGTQYFSNEWIQMKVTTDKHAIAFTNSGWAADVVVRGEQINGKQKGKVKIELTGKEADIHSTIMIQTEDEKTGEYFGGLSELLLRDSPTNQSNIKVDVVVPRDPGYPYQIQQLDRLIVKDRKGKNSLGKLYLGGAGVYRARSDIIIADINPTHNIETFGGSWFNADPYGMFIYQSDYMNDGAKLLRLNDLGSEWENSTLKTVYADILTKKLKVNLRGSRESVDDTSLSWCGMDATVNPNLLPNSLKYNRDATIVTFKYNLKEKDLFEYSKKK